MREQIKIDWKKQNKLALRNFSESCDLHDILKVLLMRLLRRAHPDSKSVPIYSEYNPLDPNEEYPDIWMQLGKDVYVWEIQKTVTDEWTMQINKKYEEVNLIIVPIKEVIKKLDAMMNSSPEQFSDRIKKLSKVLEVYVI